MFEKHFFILTKLILRRYKEIPDKYRSVCRTGWQCGGTPLILRTVSLLGDALYITTSHIVSHILPLFWMGSLVSTVVIDIVDQLLAIISPVGQHLASF